MQELARNLRSLSIALTGVILALVAGWGSPALAAEPTEVSFPTTDGGEVHALLYGSGEHGVVLAHGKVFDKYSWAPLAPKLAEAGLQVLAIDFRGYGKSRPGSEGDKFFLDLVAAMSYLKDNGATRVSLVGASLGGGVASRTAVVVGEEEIYRLVLLAPSAIRKADQMHAKSILYITSEGDPSAGRTQEQFEKAPEPKNLEVLPGDAHAQHIFKTEQSEALVELIVSALKD